MKIDIEKQIRCFLFFIPPPPPPRKEIEMTKTIIWVTQTNIISASNILFQQNTIA